VCSPLRKGEGSQSREAFVLTKRVWVKKKKKKKKKISSGTGKVAPNKKMRFRLGDAGVL